MSTSTAVRLNAKKKIPNPNFKLEIGTTNRNNPRVIYIEGKGYISPESYKEDYTNDIKTIKYDLKRILRDRISTLDNFEKRIIVDIQIADKGVSYKKKSFLNFQFLVQQTFEPLLTLKDIKAILEPPILNIVNEFTTLIKEKRFHIYKTKT